MDNGTGEPGDGGRGGQRVRVPWPLQVAGSWSWRLLLVGAAIYLVARILGYLAVVTVPCVGALLITAMLHPLTARMRRAGFGRLAATWLTMLVAFIVVGGLAALIGIRANAEFPKLAAQVVNSARELQKWLSTGPLRFQQKQIDSAVDTLLTALDKQAAALPSTVVTGAGIVLEVLAGLILLMFVTFFLIKDGDHIWDWFCGKCGPNAGPRIDQAGRVAWLTLTHYVRGTVIIAAVHGIVIGIVMLIMGIPLWAPLAVLIFLGSFVPLAGIVVTGGLSILVTLGTKGWIAAVILLGIITLEAQLESHLLQPLVVGRMVRLHPLAVILAIATGTFAAGVPGAVIAVPLTAVIYRAWPELRRDMGTGADPPEPPPQPPPPPVDDGRARFVLPRWLGWTTRVRPPRRRQGSAPDGGTGGAR
ncbi:MAG TPA: AI-2E family transporter [Streptosporangiaceae bacterium]